MTPPRAPADAQIREFRQWWCDELSKRSRGTKGLGAMPTAREVEAMERGWLAAARKYGVETERADRLMSRLLETQSKLSDALDAKYCCQLPHTTDAERAETERLRGERDEWRHRADKLHGQLGNIRSKALHPEQHVGSGKWKRGKDRTVRRLSVTTDRLMQVEADLRAARTEIAELRGTAGGVQRALAAEARRAAGGPTVPCGDMKRELLAQATPPTPAPLDEARRDVVEAVMGTQYPDHRWRLHYEQEPGLNRRAEEVRLDAAQAVLRALQAPADPWASVHKALQQVEAYCDPCDPPAPTRRMLQIRDLLTAALAASERKP